MNRVVLIGRLTKDPELRQSQGGKSICSFTLAVDRRTKSEGQPSADFIRCKAFGKTADNLAKYMSKGSLIAIGGSIQTGSYTNQQGQKIYTTDVLAQEIVFLESKKASGSVLQQPSFGYQQSESQYGFGQPSNGFDEGDFPF